MAAMTSVKDTCPEDITKDMDETCQKRLLEKMGTDQSPVEKARPVTPGRQGSPRKQGLGFSVERGKKKASRHELG